MNKIRVVEAEQIRSDLPDFSIGDTLKIHYKIIEGKTERVQVFEGLCIAIKRAGIRKTFKVRKISYGVGVERTFPLNSPRIQKIEISRRGRVRRAKLYYIRDRVGKQAKVAELITKKPRAEQGGGGSRAERPSAERPSGRRPADSRTSGSQQKAAQPAGSRTSGADTPAEQITEDKD
jgi:large subunit ribosomal protein L19